MGYNVHPRLIEQNEELLRAIRKSLEVFGEARLSARLEDLSSEQYRVRRVLRATDLFPTVLGGEFFKMGEQLSVRVDSERSEIVLSPRARIERLKIRLPDETDVLRSLPTYRGNFHILTFSPSESFSIEKFASDLRELGWELFADSQVEEEDGRISFAVERISLEESSRSDESGFGILFPSESDR